MGTVPGHWVELLGAGIGEGRGDITGGRIEAEPWGCTTSFSSPGKGRCLAGCWAPAWVEEGVVFRSAPGTAD